ncbi:hypothetical protein EOPP23_02500 [Endozoicomonas sp. OPT23]|nr:hypothetical protein [Endozoicomonas sp. OPT23]
MVGVITHKAGRNGVPGHLARTVVLIWINVRSAESRTFYRYFSAIDTVFGRYLTGVYGYHFVACLPVRVAVDKE